MATKQTPFSALLEVATGSNEANYAQLGRFITAFATAEGAIHMLARRLAGVSDEKARVIFGGMRATDVVDRIRAMMRIDKIDSQSAAEAETCLSQFNLISERRHMLVHRSSSYFDGRIVVTDVLTARNALKIEVSTFDHAELTAMLLDCFAIFSRLWRVLNPEKGEDDPSFIAVIMQPWRYRPSPPKPPNPKLPKAHKSRKRQRPASQA